MPTSKHKDTNGSYTYITEYEEIIDAAIVLSQSSYLILDCEGHNIGRTGGGLSLLAIGTARAERVFIFDVLCLSDPTNPSLAALLSLLSNEATPKVMWDGRCDYVEIWDLFGIRMKGMWDLQVAEVVSRPLRGEGENQRLAALAHRAAFTWKVVGKESALFQGIHMVHGLTGCMRALHLDNTLRKNPEVVAMHKAGETQRWMERPLSPELLHYSAIDIYLIASVFTYFDDHNFLLSDLPAQSARYIEPQSSQTVSRTHKDLEDEIGSGKFLPLGVLNDPSLQDGPLYDCPRCRRSLDLTCYANTVFTMKPASIKNGKVKPGGKIPVTDSKREKMAWPLSKRKTFCRLCTVCGMKSGVDLYNDWLEI